MNHYNVYKELMNTYHRFRNYGNPLKWYSYKRIIFVLGMIVSLAAYFAVNEIWDSNTKLIDRIINQILIAEACFVAVLIIAMFSENKKATRNLKKLIRKYNFHSNVSYNEIRYSLIYKRLRAIKFLFGSNEDVELIKSYISLLEKERDSIPDRPIFILGGTIVIFSIPIWDKIIEQILQRGNYTISSYLLCFLILTIIIGLIYTGYMLISIYFALANKRRKDITSMINWLYEIQINLEIEACKEKAISIPCINKKYFGIKRLINNIHRFFFC